MDGQEKKLSEVMRFWSKVEVRSPEECWTWKAGKFSDGYGAFMMADGKLKKASRALWLMMHGTIAEGLVVMHKCDVRLCVNPKHLQLGSLANNSEDMAVKGRASQGDEHYARARPELLARGSKVGTSKLTEAQVKEILEFYKNWPRDQRTGKPKRGLLPVLAKEYGVSRQLVWQICTGKWWTHLSNNLP